jgi:hypothetical protein
MQHVKPNNKTKSKHKRARRKGKQGALIATRHISICLKTLAGVQHAAALLHNQRSPPISAGGSVGRRLDLAHSHKLRCDRHEPREELRAEEELDLTRRQKTQGASKLCSRPA